VVAEILIRSGAYLGHDLNRAFDDLLFTYLFKRSKHFPRHTDRDKSEYGQLFALHERLLFGHRPLLRQWRPMLEAGCEHALGRYGWRWVFQRWSNAIAADATKPASSHWGWKEPNSMYFLKEIREYYPKTRFVLVLRNGLDMAYSGNRQQLDNWGPRFQIDPNDMSPPNRLEYWYRSNLAAIETLQELYGDDYLLVKLERLCLDKEHAIGELIAFAGLDSASLEESTVWDIPQLPNSYHRYRRFDTSWIDQETKGKLGELGYSIDRL
jgi:hypothetical protein